MKHIVSFSGGKDSTAMLLRMLEEDMTVDEILFCDTGKDFPDMIVHIEQVKKHIKEQYNKEIITLKADKSFDYYMFEHEKSRGKNKGKKRLWMGNNVLQMVYKQSKK
jgi:3'-phosphoadenosine 5'-phosphosulfate sulfotransferase (PAPS reductase)/FAD synthetase